MPRGCRRRTGSGASSGAGLGGGHLLKGAAFAGYGSSDISTSSAGIAGPPARNGVGACWCVGDGERLALDGAGARVRGTPRELSEEEAALAVRIRGGGPN